MRAKKREIGLENFCVFTGIAMIMVQCNVFVVTDLVVAVGVYFNSPLPPPYAIRCDLARTGVLCNYCENNRSILYGFLLLIMYSNRLQKNQLSVYFTRTIQQFQLQPFNFYGKPKNICTEEVIIGIQMLYTSRYSRQTKSVMLPKLLKILRNVLYKK